MFKQLLRLLLFGRPGPSASTRYTWWQLVDWEDVGPQTWYVQGEIIEA